jgi:HlyD family secretion protein
MKKVVAVIAVLLLLAGGSFFFLGANGKPANGITTVNPVRGAVVVKAVAIGQIEPIHQISVKSKTSGIVRRVFVEVGDRVRAGQALIEVEPDPTPLEYAEARRQVELERVALDNARAVFERSRELKHQGVISARDFDEAERGFRDAEVRVKLAEERLTIIDKGKVKIAERAVETTLKAPVAGTILERKVNEGDPVVPLTSYQAGTELLTLADMGTLLFRGTVDEIDVGKIAGGMPVTLKIGALPDRPIAGRLSKISPKARKVDNATVFDVEVEIGDRGDAVWASSGAPSPSCSSSPLAPAWGRSCGGPFTAWARGSSSSSRERRLSLRGLQPRARHYPAGGRRRPHPAPIDSGGANLAGIREVGRLSVPRRSADSRRRFGSAPRVQRHAQLDCRPGRAVSQRPRPFGKAPSGFRRGQAQDRFVQG